MTKAGVFSTDKPVYVAVGEGGGGAAGRGRRCGRLSALCVLLLLIGALLLGVAARHLLLHGLPCVTAQHAGPDMVAAVVSDVTEGVEHVISRREAANHRNPAPAPVNSPAAPKQVPAHPAPKTESKSVSKLQAAESPAVAAVALDVGAPVVAGADPRRQDEPYTFEDIFDPALRPRGLDAQWNSDSVFTYRDHRDGNVYAFDAPTGNRSLLLNNQTLAELGTGTYYVSPDMLYVLIAHELAGVWRHSFTARYVVYDVTQDSLLEFPNNDTLAGEVLQFASWGHSGNTLSFVHGNDLYVQPGVQEPAQRVTSTGSPSVFNGVPDWLYEEDVVGSSRGHFFSAADDYLVFVTYNVTGVPLQAWPTYGSKDDVYGTTARVAYPKAGDTQDGELGALTAVTLSVLSTADPTAHTLLQPPAKFADQDHYYTCVAWSDDNRVFVTWTNRAQNETVYMLYDPATGAGQQNLEFQVPNGWVDSPATEPLWVAGEAAYWTILSETIGNDSWPHVALVTAPLNSEGTVTFVASGEMAVSSLAGYDPSGHYIFYIATNFDPTERHLFRAGTQDAAEPAPVCLTCGFPVTCRYVTAWFSTAASFYIEGCRGPDVPAYRLTNPTNSTHVVLEDNADVRARLAVKQLPTRSFIEFPVTDGYMARADVYYPFNFDITAKYKVLLYPYAGPNSQRVVKTFPLGSNTNNWLMHLKSTEHNVVVASVDARGTVLRSDHFRYLMYRRLGVVEIEDQLAAARHFRGQDYFDNDDNMAMFGWSYGGFVTAKTLAQSGPEELQCGVSIAPVTSFRYYDSAYTERYMAFDLSGDNQAGYNNTDVMSLASQFHGKTFMIGHGTADDNVHFMQTAQLVNALVQEEFQFRQLIYPDENHSIGGDKAARHLYRAMTTFLTDDCWA